MEPRRVFLTGATGFIGGHLLAKLAGRGHRVTCLVRAASPGRAALVGADRVVVAEWTAPATWSSAVAGHDAVVNAVGIIRERPGASFGAVHTVAPLALFGAAARGGMRKIVQISALGAEEAAVSRYHRSKRAADRALAELGVPYLVLRPSFVYGSGECSMRFFERLARLPITPVAGDGQYRVQPVAVEDLVRAIVLAVERDDLRDLAVDLGGRAAVTFDALLDLLARQGGKPGGARKLHLPWGLMQLIAGATDALGGRGPSTSEELGMLRRGSVADNGAFVERFGFEPIGLEEGLVRGAIQPGRLAR
jgi:NADH dehydrogenase